MWCRAHVVAACVAVAGCVTTPPNGLAPYRVAGDAIDQALTAAAADSTRGRQIVIGRDSNCLLCHALPETGARFMGNLAPSLSGVGARLTAGQLRMRIVDSSRLNRDTIMPAYYRIDGLNEVAPSLRGKPILSAQQIEDVIAYLVTLREAP